MLFFTINKIIVHQLTIQRTQRRQMNAEARGWMDPIPDWVGNRSLALSGDHGLDAYGWNVAVMGVSQKRWLVGMSWKIPM